MKAKAMIARFAKDFHGVFSVKSAGRRPLAKSIHKVLLAYYAAEDGIDPKHIRRSMSAYCRSTPYLRSCVAGVPRVSIFGFETVPVTAEDEAYAKSILSARKAKKAVQHAV